MPADAAPLMTIFDEERDLGDLAAARRGLVEQVVAAHGHHVLVVEHDERHALLVVDLGEVAQFVGAQLDL